MIKKSSQRKQRAKLKVSAGWFVLVKKIKNNFIAYYLLLSKASPKKLQPYYHTFIYTLIRRIASLIIKIKRALLFKKIATFKTLAKLIILSLKKTKSHNLTDYLALPKFSRQLLFRIFTSILIISLISAQSIAVSGFEAHVINVTAKIVNDVPLIQPSGGEFCNLSGATITITSAYNGTSTIIYTIDDFDPVCPTTGTIYTAPFTIYQSATVKARTCHDGKQSAVTSQYFDVSSQFCEQSSCNAETINYWQVNGGCELDPAVSQQTTLINNLSLNNFQGAFATTTGGEICMAFDLTSCPAENTLEGELCRARGQTLAVMSNLVTGRLDLNAVLAGAFDNSANFTNLNLTASSTIEQVLDKIESVLVDPGATQTDLTNAKFVAQRIYTFYNSENPYAPEPTCIYYEPGEVVLNEFVPNPSCDAQPVDVVMVMDRSGSMDDTSRCDWWQLECVNYPSCSLGYDWVQKTNYNQTQVWCAEKNKSAPHQSVWTQYSPIKIDAAKQAADDFIDLMGTEDQSALVSYATTAALDKFLSDNHALTKTAINGLNTAGATNIGDAIALANTELTAGNANPAAAKVEILLTDGMANKPFGPGYGEWPADVAYAKAKADEAAAQGIKIFAIGLGDDVNTAMLQYIASTTGAQYYFAPTGADLQAIYTQISEALCSGDDDQKLLGLAGEWAELYNNGTGQKNLADWLIDNTYATSTIKISSENTLASSTIIGAYGSGAEWLVVLFNGARLNNNGDTIFLYDNSGHLIDFYSYVASIDNDPDSDPANTPVETNTLDGNLAGQEGKSFARIPDGTGPWIDPIPTPGGPNKLEGNINITVQIVNETASSSPEIISSQNVENSPAQVENSNSNDSGGQITESTPEVRDRAVDLNNSDQPVIEPPTASSTPESVSGEENTGPNQPVEENNGEPATSSDLENIQSGNEINGTAGSAEIEQTTGNDGDISNKTLGAPEEIQTEPLPEPAITESVPEPAPIKEPSTVIEAPREPAIEPAKAPTEPTPNSETTIL